MIQLNLPPDAVRSSLLSRGMVRVSEGEAQSVFQSDDWSGVVVAVRNNKTFGIAAILQSIKDFQTMATFDNTEYYIGEPSMVRSFTPHAYVRDNGHELILTINLDNCMAEWLDQTNGYLRTQRIAGVRVQVVENGESSDILERNFG